MKISKRKKILYTFIILLIIVFIIIFINRHKIIESSQIKQAYEVSNETIQATYLINEVNGDDMNVTVKIKSTVGIEEIITPDNLEISAYGKNTVAMDYDVINGNNYTFKVKLKGKDNYNDYTLTADKDSKPNIKVGGNAYPTLTENGVVIRVETEIEYEGTTNNYYSIDNDDLIEYTGPIIIDKDGIITAKTLVNEKITKEDKKIIDMNKLLANDALPKEAYDGRTDTYVSYRQTSSDTKSVGYMLVSSEMMGRAFQISSRDGSVSGGQGGVIIYFYNNNTQLSSTTVRQPWGGYTSVTIPENTTKMQFFIKANGGWSGGKATSYLYDITI